MQTCRCRCFCLNYFRSWMIRICRVLDEKEDHNEPQLPVFVFVLTKFKKMPNVASVSMGCMASMEISVTPYWVYSPGDNSRRFILHHLADMSLHCLADLFVHTPNSLLWNEFSHAPNTMQRLFIHTFLPLSVGRYSSIQ